MDAITVGAPDNYLFDEVWPQTTRIFTCQEKSVCVLAHIQLLTGAAASQPKIACVSSMKELVITFAGVVAAALLTPT